MDKNNNDSDLRLVERLRAGECAAFGTIMARYQSTLLAVARAYLGNREDAADAVQDALVLAYLHLVQLQDPQRLGAWLRRVTLNVCRQRLRTRRPITTLDAVAETGMDHTQTTDTRLLIEQALACLSPETRLTVLLFYRREMSLEEIATFQEVPTTTIKSRLRNARARLRKEMETILEETITQESKPGDITPRVLHRLEAAGTIFSGAISPDGAAFITGVALEVTPEKFDARIAAWEVTTGNPLWASDLTSWFRSVLFTPDGSQVVVATGLPGRRDGRDGRLLFLDAATGEAVREIPTASGALGMALSPDGRYAAAGFSEPYQDYRSHGDKGVVRVYDLATGEQTHVFEPHLNHVATVAFSPDGKTLASSGLLRDADPEAKDIWLRADVRLWDLATGANLYRLARPTAGGTIHNIAFSPDGALVAAPNGPEGEVLLWNAKTGALVRTLPGAGSHVFALAFSPDGQVLATGGGDTKVRLFDLASGQLRQTLEGHAHRLATLAFTPDGATLITADMEGCVQFWQLPNAGD